MSVDLLINVPRTELLSEGFARTRTAPGFVFARLGSVQRPNGTFVTEFVEGAPATKVWQEPETGVVMLRPSALDPKLFEDAAFQGLWAGTTSGTHRFRVAPNTFLDQALTFEGGGGVPIVMHLQRSDGATHTVQEISNPGADLVNLKALFESPIAWAMQSSFSLHDNESFAVWIQPTSVVTESPTTLLVFAFGQKWAIELLGNGNAVWYENTRTQAQPTWVRRQVVSLLPGGFSDRAVMICVIPWGIDAISLVASEGAPKDKVEASSYNSRAESATLFRIRPDRRADLYNSSTSQYVKARAGAVTIGLRTKATDYKLAFHRSRYYSADVAFHLMPESLDRPKTGTPSLSWIGYFGQRRTAFGEGARVNTGADLLTDEGGASWSSATDTKMAARARMFPDPDNLYSPEIWALEYNLAQQTHTPSVTSFSQIDETYELRFTLSIEPRPQRAEWRSNRSADQRFLFKLDGGVQITVDGSPVFDGYISQYKPTQLGSWSEAGRHFVRTDDEASALDMWMRLEDTPAKNFRSLTGRTLYSIIQDAIRRAGFSGAQVQLVAGSEILNSLTVDGWDEPNDWKTSHEGSSMADIVRQVIQRYSVQGRRGIRVLWRNGAWRVGLSTRYEFKAPSHDVTKLPATIFVCGSDMWPLNGSSEPTDAQRWAGYGTPLRRYFKVFSQPEFDVKRPRFNQLTCSGATLAGDSARALLCFIAAHPRSLTDSTYWDFIGSIRPYEIGNPETAICTTYGELERFARRAYDEDGLAWPRLQLEAEWQPVIDVDQIIWLWGTATTNIPELSIVAGQLVSYGAWRIEEIDVQLRSLDFGVAPSFGGAITDRKWARQATYQLSFAGPAFEAAIPMFSDRYPPTR